MAKIKKQNRLTKKEIITLFQKAVEKIINDSPYAAKNISTDISEGFNWEMRFSIYVSEGSKIPTHSAVQLSKYNDTGWNMWAYSKTFDKGIQEMLGKLVLAVTDTSDLEGAIMTEELEPATVNLLFT
jgi:hypothetical protein